MESKDHTYVVDTYGGNEPKKIGEIIYGDGKPNGFIRMALRDEVKSYFHNYFGNLLSKSGAILLKIIFDSNSNPFDSVLYSYNTLGLITGFVSNQSTSSYMYDQSNNLLKNLINNINGQSLINEYNKDGLIFKITNNSDTGNIYTNLIEFDNDGYSTSKKLYDSYGYIYNEKKYFFENNKLIKTTEITNDSTHQIIINYEYNGEFLTNQTIKDNQLYGIKTYNYFYNNDGNLIETDIYTNGKQQYKVFYEYYIK